VSVTVVDVREMRVTVGQRVMNVDVGMGVARRVIRPMGMLVVSVVSVRVGV
jgi:hypothetical protein